MATRMDVKWRHWFSIWIGVTIGFGGCGAGLNPPSMEDGKALRSVVPQESSSAFTPGGAPLESILDSPSCPPWPPPSEGLIVNIASGDVQGFLRQLRKAQPGTTFVLEPGVYALSKKQSLRIKVPGVTIRGVSDKPAAVRIEGGASSMTVAASHVTIADLTIANPRFHAIHVRGERGVSHTTIYHVHLLDAGQQFIKVSAGTNAEGPYGDKGLIACSLIEYTTYSKGNGRTSPSYTNGVDILAGNDWVVRDNTIRRIRSEQGPAGPAILVWKNAQGTVIKRNRIVDSWRGIALGLMAPGKRSRQGHEGLYDHQNGVVENNIILAIREPADAAIENNFARNSNIFHNTIFYRKDLPHPTKWSIEYRFPPTTGIVIKNNLTNLPIRMRHPFPHDHALSGGNITTADADWFVDILHEDAHLTSKAIPIDHGLVLPETAADIDGTARPQGPGFDSGADEYEPTFQQAFASSGGD